MKFIDKIITSGIHENMDAKRSRSIRTVNIVLLTSSLIFFFTAMLGIVFQHNNAGLINFSTVLALLATYFIIPFNKKIELSRLVLVIIVFVASILNYLFVNELTTEVLTFTLFLPVAAIFILSNRGIWFSLALLAIIIVSNYFPPDKDFIPRSNENIIIWAVTFIIILIASLYSKRKYEYSIKLQTDLVAHFKDELKQKDEFIGQLSHKLRTSLGSITLINNLVNDFRMSSAQSELLEALKVSTQNLINDVNELVEIAAPSISDFKQSILSFDLYRVIDSISEGIDPVISQNIPVTINKNEDLEYYLIGDPSHLRAVFDNMFRGVSAYASREKGITINIRTVSHSQNNAEIEYSFEFEIKGEESKIKASISKELEQQSSDLGIANKLLALTGGILSFKGNENRFGFSFAQIYSKDLTKKTIKVGIPKKGKEFKKDLSSASILLVEDNAINQKIVILSLDNIVNRIDVANNGKEALDMFVKKNYDTILMDIQMPIMDGITATKKIRELESTSEVRIPIIAITANALSGDKDTCIAAGADEYLSKPFQVEDLINKLDALITG